MFSEGQTIGLYILVKRLGRGAFGEVWLAERRTKFVTTKVAVKLPLDEQVDHEAVKQEATLWEQASGHPNVLPIIDADDYDGQVVIVSEYAPDGSLEELLGKEVTLPIKKAVELTVGILNGLEFLHTRQIIHRDIKPANILLQGNTPRLADFGISRAMKTTSVSINMSGTPKYMAPEAFDGKRTTETDIWSVGVVLYQMIKGSLPFPSDELTELLGAVVMKEPEPLPEAIPKSLQEIIFKALAKNPIERYRSALEMRDELAEFLISISQSRFTREINAQSGGKSESSPSDLISQTQPGSTAPNQVSSPNTERQKLVETQKLENALQILNSQTYQPKPNYFYLKILAPLACLVLLLIPVGLYFLVSSRNTSSNQNTRQNTSTDQSTNQNISTKPAAEGGLIPFRQGDKFGFCDQNKKLVIAAKYDFAAPFSNDLALVNQGMKMIENGEIIETGNYGFIDQNGVEVIPLKYKYATSFSEGLAFATSQLNEMELAEDNYGNNPADLQISSQKGGMFIDLKGNTIFPVQYDFTTPFNEGFSKVVNRRSKKAGDFRMGFIDKSGKEVVPLIYNYVDEYSDGMALVSVDAEGTMRAGYVDVSGKVVIPLKFRSRWQKFSNGLAAQLTDNGYVFINKSGEEVSRPSWEGYQEIHDFSEGLIVAVKAEMHYGFIDKDGKEIISFIYQVAGSFKNGVARVMLGEKWGYIDKTGKEVIPIKYNHARGNFENGFALVRLGKRSFYVDKNGTEFYEP